MPFWGELGGHPGWQWLFKAPDSPVVKRIAECHSLLANERINEPSKIAYLRGVLATLMWLERLPTLMYAEENKLTEEQQQAVDRHDTRRKLAWLPRVF
jgi:hypothetical protein